MVYNLKNKIMNPFFLISVIFLLTEVTASPGYFNLIQPLDGEYEDTKCSKFKKKKDRERCECYWVYEWELTCKKKGYAWDTARPTLPPAEPTNYPTRFPTKYPTKYPTRMPSYRPETCEEAVANYTNLLKDVTDKCGKKCKRKVLP